MLTPSGNSPTPWCSAPRVWVEHGGSRACGGGLHLAAHRKQRASKGQSADENPQTRHADPLPSVSTAFQTSTPVTRTLARGQRTAACKKQVTMGGEGRQSICDSVPESSGDSRREGLRLFDFNNSGNCGKSHLLGGTCLCKAALLRYSPPTEGDTCHQQPEFNSLSLRDGRRDPSLTRCSLTSTHSPCHAYHQHTQTR